ncbi:hypothetical protein Tcan_05762 [Toxocara canis]|uniref:Uncharacterized protein n=1 Tax=Toxocara canis TaxID=6265 RepID=A0A0B2VY64_TOXCA|nr:hypothetical protein Tcan_05762 [Toxocara canis]
MGSRVALLLLCLLCAFAVCTGRVNRPSSLASESPSVSPFTLNGQDGVLKKIEGFFDGKYSLDFTIFGYGLHIRIPKVPSSWDEVKAAIRRFMKQLRNDPFTRTFTVICANIILLVAVYAVLFVLNIHLALKHRRAIAAANDGKPLLRRTHSVKIDISDDISRAFVVGSTANANLRRRALDAGLGSGRAMPLEESNLKRRLSFSSSEESEIPRLVGDSIGDTFYESLVGSAQKNVHSSRDGETERDKHSVPVEVHKIGAKEATVLNVEKPRGSFPEYDTIATSDQFCSVDESHGQYDEIKSPKYEEMRTHSGRT